MNREAFMERYGGVYEHSPWIAARLWEGSGGAVPQGAAALARAMAAVLDKADEDAKLELLRAHPDLAGKAAIAGELTKASSAEQARAGLDACSPDEFARFTRLNAAYRKKFGFPFIIAVKGLDRQAILDAFAHRLQQDRDTEFATALAEVNKIARLRLEALEEGA